MRHTQEICPRTVKELPLRIGAHVSVSGGYRAAMEYASEVGAESIQIFAKSPRQWRGKPIAPEAGDELQALTEEFDIGPVFTHTAYLINLATEKDDMWEKSIAALADELERGRTLGAAGVITHVGSNADRAFACERITAAIAEVHRRVGERPDGCPTRLLMENSAGAGNHYGATATELLDVINAGELSTDHLGICIDTCHAHAAGVDLTDAAGWRTLTEEVDSAAGKNIIGAIHVNDCMFELGSKRDRHAWIGDGTMGEDAFRAMFAEPALADVPALLEMPGEIPEKDAVNIERLKDLREAVGK